MNQAATRAVDLLPLTVPEVRRLLGRVVWRQLPRIEQVLGWSHWRRRHQARAKRCHWRRHLARLPTDVRL